MEDGNDFGQRKPVRQPHVSKFLQKWPKHGFYVWPTFGPKWHWHMQKAAVHPCKRQCHCGPAANNGSGDDLRQPIAPVVAQTLSVIYELPAAHGTHAIVNKRCTHAQDHVPQQVVARERLQAPRQRVRFNPIPCKSALLRQCIRGVNACKIAPQLASVEATVKLHAHFDEIYGRHPHWMLSFDAAWERTRERLLDVVVCRKPILPD